jgi:hypothetical protein
MDESSVANAVAAQGFEEIQGADDIRLNGVGGVADGAVDVRFGGKMDDDVGAVSLPDLADGRGVAQVSLFKDVVGEICDVGHAGGHPGVGERVEVDEPDRGMTGSKPNQEVGTDKAAASRHQNDHF